MAKNLKTKDEVGEGLLLNGVDEDVQEDLIVFRWLERQISNKKAIRACLLVLQGISCNAVLPDASQEGGI